MLPEVSCQFWCSLGKSTELHDDVHKQQKYLNYGNLGTKSSGFWGLAHSNLPRYPVCRWGWRKFKEDPPRTMKGYEIKSETCRCLPSVVHTTWFCHPTPSQKGLVSPQNRKVSVWGSCTVALHIFAHVRHAANPDTLVSWVKRTPTRKRFPHSTACECLN